MTHSVNNKIVQRLLLVLIAMTIITLAEAQVGVGAKAPADAEIFFDGTREMLDTKWTYWKGPGFAGALPIKWRIVLDPVNIGTVVNGNDPTAAGGKYGSADIVTKKEFRDARIHVEFLIMKPGGNSGVYIQNRYEIQVLDGDSTKHGLGAVINETESPYYAYNGVGKWNAYDIIFRAARFKNGKLTEKPIVTLYFNGKKAHTNQKISQVWGGPNSGIDGGNDGGKGITDKPGGLKLQAEGHDVLFRNIWIKELTIDQPDTDLAIAANNNPGASNVLRHVVMFKFKDSSKAEDIKKVEDAFRSLADKLSLIKDFEWGKNSSPENLNQGLTHCFLVTFSSEKDRDTYLTHPDHQAFVEILKPHLDKVTVVDYWAGK
jgi:hypothetical protein